MHTLPAESRNCMTSEESLDVLCGLYWLAIARFSETSTRDVQNTLLHKPCLFMGGAFVQGTLRTPWKTDLAATAGFHTMQRAPSANTRKHFHAVQENLGSAK